MTQDPRQYPGQYPYPSPYGGPDPAALGYAAYPGAFDPYTTLRAPARRAGLMMIIVGSLGLLCGACMSFVFYLVLHPPTGPEWAQFNQQRTQILAQLQGSGQTPEHSLVMSVITLVVAIALVILGIPVRRGGKTIVRVAMALNAAICGLAALWFLRDLITIVATRHFEYLPVLIVPAIPLAIFGILVMLLIQASRNTGRLVEVQSQYQQQMWQYQQQQQAYSQGVYPPVGYGGPQMPPSAFQPPPPPPPQQPPFNPPGGGAT